MHARRRRICALIGASSMVINPLTQAQDIDFQLLRYEDDLSAARVEAAEGRESLKAIPLGAGAWLSLGGEFRLRFERATAPGLGAVEPGLDVYGLHRALIHADLQANDKLRAFVQLGAYAAPGKTGAAPPAEDALDLQQAFVDLALPIGAAKMTTRFGRQELALGSQRLIGLRDGPNARLSFDGVRLLYTLGEANVDVLLLRPVQQRKGSFNNRPTPDASLSGVYATLPAHPLPSAVDFYLMRYERPNGVFANASGEESRWSGGVRLYGGRGAWDWDTEATVQTGEIGDQSIKAWGLATDTGATMNLETLRVRLGAKINLSSGDRRREDGQLNTGNAYYPKLPYLGSAATFAPSNIVDVHPELTVSKGRGALTLGYQAVWRMTTADAVYIGPLTPLPNTAGQGSRFTAQQWSVDASWRASASLRVDAALAWVNATSSLEALGAQDSAIAFAAITWRF